VHPSTIITADGTRTLTHERYGETYHSINGAQIESQHVFLQASGVEARTAQAKPTSVLEIGFGLGLNALLTADLALTHGALLRYDAFENDLVDASVIARMDYAESLQHPEITQQLLSKVSAVQRASSLSGESPPNIQATLALDGAADSPSVQLQILLADATTSHILRNHYHAIYLDAFSPDCNAECWSESFFCKLAPALTHDGKLTTYSAKGRVRRAMQAAGFVVNKIPGPPGKREMLVASLGQ